MPLILPTCSIVRRSDCAPVIAGQVSPHRQEIAGARVLGVKPDGGFEI
jgi:hypothetical protein